MKKVHLFLLLITVSVFSMMSCQNDKNELFDEMENLENSSKDLLSENGTEKRTCGHTHHMQGLLEKPEYKRAHEEKLEKVATMAQARMACSSPVILPMAVHFQGVSNPNTNCLRQLAQSQVAILNADYSGTNGDISQWTNGASSSFPGINNGETCIQFCLATKNHPTGYGLNDGDIAVTINKTTGDNVADWSGYINIFVQPNLSFLGYSPLGGSGNGDGVVIDANAFGTGSGCGNIKPNNPYDLGRTLTHELGHYLLLDHVWGEGGCNSDDNVADTPTCSQENYGCPSIGISSCNSKDLHMNYMDYTNDACMYMFTAGQSTRMENYVATSLQNVVSKA
ncbi:MAG: M43 family zinc metalloprotease, partial [Bacteroidota bacterium]